MKVFLCILAGVIIWLLGCLLGTLIFWGIGLLVCKVFVINYVWTIWHGLLVYIIYCTLRNLFSGGK